VRNTKLKMTPRKTTHFRALEQDQRLGEEMEAGGKKAEKRKKSLEPKESKKKKMILASPKQKNPKPQTAHGQGKRLWG